MTPPRTRPAATTAPIDITEAHRIITTTTTPLAEIAGRLSCSVLALEKRLERHCGKRSRELRTGAFPTPGRTPGNPRKRWEVRLTPAERAAVEAAVEAAGAETDGAALALICAEWLGRNLPEPRPRRPVGGDGADAAT